MTSWIKLHRKLLDWEWYDDANAKIIFIHLLLKANYKPTRYRGYDIPAGSVVSGRKALSEQLGMSEQKIRTGLDKLKSTNEITISATAKFSIITIRCWDEYQHDNQQNNQQSTNKQPTDNQQVTTSKEGKKVKREESVGRAQRIPDDWLPSQDNILFAINEGFQENQVSRIADKFKDYWTAASGRNAAKKDWDATWRNWVRREAERVSVKKPERMGTMEAAQSILEDMRS